MAAASSSAKRQRRASEAVAAADGGAGDSGGDGIEIICSADPFPLLTLTGVGCNDLLYDEEATMGTIQRVLAPNLRKALLRLIEKRSGPGVSARARDSAHQCRSWISSESGVVPVVYSAKECGDTSWFLHGEELFDSESPVRRRKACQIAMALDVPSLETLEIDPRALGSATLACFLLDRFRTNRLCFLGLARVSVLAEERLITRQLAREMEPWNVPTVYVTRDAQAAAKREKTRTPVPKELAISVPSQRVLDEVL